MTTTPTQEEIDKAIEAAAYPAQVSFLDPDFLCFALPFAITFDLISIILTIIAFFTASVGWWVWLIIDGVAMVVIGGWIYFRTNQIVESKEEKKKEIQENLQRRAQYLEKESAEEVGKMVTKEADQLLAKEAAQEEARMAVKTAAKTEGKLLSRSIGRIFSKIGGRFLLKAIPLVGCIPFWTITVLETLNEK